MVLVQGVSWSYSRDIGENCSHAEAYLGLGICLQDTSLPWLLAGGLSPHHMTSPYSSLRVLMTWQLASPTAVTQEKESKKEATMPFEFSSGRSHTHFHHLLGEPPRPPHTQGEENETLPFEERSIKTFVDMS